MEKIHVYSSIWTTVYVTYFLELKMCGSRVLSTLFLQICDWTQSFCTGLLIIPLVSRLGFVPGINFLLSEL